jgi:protein SCO1
LVLPDEGQYIFATHCSACHSIGHGDKIGPDLLDVTHVRDRDWLARFIATPDKVLNERDPIATALFDKYQQVNMPNLRLGTADVAALISFLEAQTKAHAVPEESMGDMKTDHSAMKMDHSAMKMEPGETKQR